MLLHSIGSNGVAFYHAIPVFLSIGSNVVAFYRF